MNRRLMFFCFYLFAAAQDPPFAAAQSLLNWVGTCPPYFFKPGDATSLENAKKSCKADQNERGDCQISSTGTAPPPC